MRTSLCSLAGSQKNCGLSRTWFTVPAWSVLPHRCFSSWSPRPEISTTGCDVQCTMHMVRGHALWHQAKSDSVFNFNFFFSWDIIVTGYGISKRWNASDSATYLCNLLGFSFCSSKACFVSVLHGASQWGRNYINLSITLVSPKCYSWFEQVNLYE